MAADQALADEARTFADEARTLLNRRGSQSMLCGFYGGGVWCVAVVPCRRHAGGNAVTRDDKLVGDVAFFLGSGRVLVAEEKVDGANIGISVSSDFKIQHVNHHFLLPMTSAVRAPAHTYVDYLLVFINGCQLDLGGRYQNRSKYVTFADMTQYSTMPQWETEFG
jgi:hypothetical protein